jgi:tRNA(fMet)-specific endonuclease VapC
MKRILLDTSAYSAFFRGHAGVVQEVRTAGEILFSPVVLGELHAGFRRGTHRQRNEHELEAFLTSPRVNTLVIDSETALRYAEIVTFLRRSGTPIPTDDVWIAASAMQSGATLLTTDAHFDRIPQVLVGFHSP